MIAPEIKAKKVLTKDPLFLLGVGLLIFGLGLLVYGLVPQQQPAYTFLTSMHVPLNDSQGNFVLDPESYFHQHFQGPGSADRVDCAVQPGGWLCYAYEITGTQLVFNSAARTYGLGLLGVGALSVLAAYKLDPFRPRQSLARPIRVRIDEDICVANGVCVALAPTVFQFKKQELPTIFAPLAYVIDPNGADFNTILNAAQMCPTGAVILEDAETGEQIHPPLPKN